MERESFSPMDIDGIGEIMSISLGSSAKAASNMLNHRVSITTPRVSIIPANELTLTLGDIDPFIGVECRYISGLEGSNILFLKRNDAKTVVNILRGSEITTEELQSDELTNSAVCEMMNQMMGAAATALSDFLGKLVEISTPQFFEMDEFEQFKTKLFPPDDGKAVVVRFGLTIENILNSEFVNVISVELAHELIHSFMSEELINIEAQPQKTPEAVGYSTKQDNALNEAEIQNLFQQQTAASQDVEASTVPVASNGEQVNCLPHSLPQGNMPPYGYAMGGYPPMHPQGYQGYYYPPMPTSSQMNPKVISTQQPAMPHMDAVEHLGEEQAQNLELIMSVPLEISVEIGRARKKVKDILTFSRGSLLVLDKMAGDQVELYVNGQCIAKGDVVIIDDNFGIRVTEILKPVTTENLLKL